MQTEEIIHILLVEDNPGDAVLIREMLCDSKNCPSDLTIADSLSSAFVLLSEHQFDLMLLDLGLPESQGIDTLQTVLQHHIPLPIVVITGFASDSAGLLAVQIGAQDYLIKGQIDTDLLIRSIRYAIERFHIKEALAASEMKYRTLIEQANDAIFLVDLESGFFIDANRKAQDLVGRSRDEIHKMHYSALFPPEEKEIYSAIHNSLLSGDQGAVREGSVMHHTGMCIPMEISSSVIEVNNVRLILGIFRDISERKRAEQALMQAQRKLNILNSVTFEDIQNTVFTLTAFLEIQDDQGLDPLMKEYIEKEHALAIDLQKSIEFMKDYQNMGINTPQWHNVLQTFLFAISHLDISGLSRIITLDTLEIYSDPLLEKVLIILIDNVIRHGKTATEMVFRYNETGDGVTLIFEDNGIGVLDQEKEKIFERGYGKKKAFVSFMPEKYSRLPGY
jgi:PAS domain S-box-containing protein